MSACRSSAMTKMPTVFVVEDDVSLREGIRSLLCSAGQHVEVFASAEEFIARRKPSPGAAEAECLVLDERLPDISGLELQRRLSKLNDPIPIVFITGHGDIQMSVQTLKSGAIDFLSKPFRDQDLLESVQAAVRHDRARRAENVELSAILASYQSLTQRECDIMQLVVSGQLNKQIAATVGLSEVTVKIHRAQVMRKMGAASLAELVRIAVRIEESMQ
jgi:FixJ family two-component response regulator